MHERSQISIFCTDRGFIDSLDGCTCAYHVGVFLWVHYHRTASSPSFGYIDVEILLELNMEKLEYMFISLPPFRNSSTARVVICKELNFSPSVQIG